LGKKAYAHNDIILLCIGTDRATGDSLGPIIGYKLSQLKLEHVFVYGNLEYPVHAKNLEETIDHIKKTHRHPTIVAIDACLGSMSHIGLVTLGEGSLVPGAGVNKNLPKVGDIYITGTVNFKGYMDLLILQHTRLHTVMKMADFIALGITETLTQHLRKNIAI
jgi:putative sporulation protein YyaC